MRKTIKQKNEEYSKFVPHLESVFDKIIYSPRLLKKGRKRIDNGFFHRWIKGILPIVEKIGKGKFSDYDISYIAQTHLDAAWKFPVVDTKVRAFMTFYKAIEHLNNKNFESFFKFSMTSPQYYDWIKTYKSSSGLWEEVKKFVKEGRWEPVGGMWVEPTLDEVWGEALCRQRLYGQLFFQREFGKISHCGSMLDVFGFPHSLPQILVKSGATSFWTTKCTWNDTNPWPMANYMWRGVDGTEIFTHHWKFMYAAMMAIGEYKKKARFPSPDKNHSVLSSKNTNQEIEECFSTEPQDYCKKLGIFYGWGDGARGPHTIEIGAHQVLAQLGHGKFTTMHDYFNKLRDVVGDKYLVWDDEMYLETHRGCKTTQVNVKKFNRRGEIWAFAVETFLTLLNLSVKPDLLSKMGDNGLVYNGDLKAQVFEIWRRVLFNQFHDILPGSSIPEVYVLAHKEQKGAYKESRALIQKTLLQMSSSEDEVVVFNPFVWNRSEYITVAGKSYYLEHIPPLSIKKYTLSDLPSLNDENQSTIITTGEYYIMENNYIKAHILKSTGTLTTLYYKSLQYEFLTTSGTYKEQGSGLRIYREGYDPVYDAWNMDKTYPRNNVDIYPVNGAVIEKGMGGIDVISTDYSFLNSSARVQYSLRPEDKMVNIRIHTDLKDAKLLVKYFVPLTLKNSTMNVEIPYASIPRTRKPKSEMEKAKWEYAMQKWVDVSDTFSGMSYGLSILNNSRYGFNATARGIYITLQRTAKYPSQAIFSTYRLIPKKERPKHTDLKPYNFDLALMPHKGTDRDIKVWQHAYNYNLPVVISEQTLNYDKVGNIEVEEPIEKIKIDIDSLSSPLFELNSSDIIMGALKPSEWTGKNLDVLTEDKDWKWDGKSIVIRLVEQAGIDHPNNEIKLTLNSDLKIAKVDEVDILERTESNIKSSGNSVALTFHKFEIKTLRIYLK